MSQHILAQVSPRQNCCDFFFQTGASSRSRRLISKMADEIVRQWRQLNQVERDMDFAFFFDSFAEASAEAGSEVAGAWRRTRSQQESGLGGRVIDLCKREAEMQQQAASRKRPLKPGEPAVPPSFAQKLRSLKTVQPQPTSKYSPLAQANVDFGPILFDVMMNASTIRPGPRDTQAEVRDAIRPLVVSLLSSTETATLQRVKSTWSEFREYFELRNKDLHDLSAIEVAGFLAQNKAPSRSMQALQWMKSNLMLQGPLDLCNVQAKPRGGKHGIGSQQAAVAQPSMLVGLEQNLKAAIELHNPAWPCLLGAWLQTFGCVRWQHLQRSLPVAFDSHNMHFVCLRGKQKNQRAGFRWAAPSHLTTIEFALYEHAAALFEKFTEPGLVIHAKTGSLQTQAVAQDEVRRGMREWVIDEDLGRISSKSWRQFGITFTVTSGMQPADQIALGNWIDSAPRGQSAMPLRYTGNKYDHSNFIKHTLHAFVSILAEYGVAGSWSDLNAADVRTWAKEASERAAEWLDTPKETLQEFRIPEAAASLFTTPLRLRTKKFIRKRQAKVESSAVSASPPLPITDDQYFDDLATQRWNRPGHAGSPEPPTVIYRHIPGLEAPCVILGGLPVQSDMGLLRDLKVELVVTCFQEHPEKKGGTVPTGAYVYQFGIAGKKRNASWEGLRKLILPALENGESIYVHCMAGVHRAPVAAALILAAVRQLPFDRMMQHIQKLRAVEPHKMIKGDVGEWVYTANIGPLPGTQVKIPAPFVTSKVDGSLMHAVPKDWDPDSPAPACRWRQSKTGSRGFYSGNIEYVDDVFAAIAYNRPFCQSCALVCPPGVQQVLWENSSTWSRQ